MRYYSQDKLNDYSSIVIITNVETHNYYNHIEKSHRGSQVGMSGKRGSIANYLRDFV